MRSVTIVGASLAGLSTARALRAQSFDGRITVVGDERHEPYDRPPLSKEFLAGRASLADIALSTEDDAELDLDWRLGTTAARLDPTRRAVVLESGEELVSDGVVVATGARARTLRGSALVDVHTLRSLDDAVALRADLLAGGPVVVIGAGFIGAEVASTARALGLDVTVVEVLPTPLAGPLGEEMGRHVAALHGDHGTKLVTGVEVVGLVGGGGHALDAPGLGVTGHGVTGHGDGPGAGATGLVRPRAEVVGSAGGRGWGAAGSALGEAAEAGRADGRGVRAAGLGGGSGAGGGVPGASRGPGADRVRVRAVRLADGRELPAATVVCGIGAVPNVEWLAGSGVEVGAGVRTDARCATNIPGVVAVGDCAWAHNPFAGEALRLEHWTNALQQPAIAAATLLGRPADTRATPPYFWSDQYGVRLQFAGHRRPGDTVEVVDGDPELRSFGAVYRRAGRPVAALALNQPRLFGRLRRQLVAPEPEVVR
jgi:NADPH-dependent 2,4-dienoyl-CoA reductase/sulfur reductase-like enzyme